MKKLTYDEMKQLVWKRRHQGPSVYINPKHKKIHLNTQKANKNRDKFVFKSGMVDINFCQQTSTIEIIDGGNDKKISPKGEKQPNSWSIHDDIVAECLDLTHPITFDSTFSTDENNNLVINVDLNKKK